MDNVGGQPVGGPPVGGPPDTQIPRMPPLDFNAAEGLRAVEAAMGGESGDPQDFEFPADMQFWDDFTTEVAIAPEYSQRKPVLAVTASHTTDTLAVNCQFLTAYMRGWEQSNPHIVSISGPNGDQIFHASREFWDRVSRVLSPTRKDGMDVMVKCDDVAYYQTVDGWNKICSQWEQHNKLTPQDMKNRKKLKRRQAAEKTAQQQKPQQPRGVVYQQQDPRRPSAAVLREGGLSFRKPNPPSPPRRRIASFNKNICKDSEDKNKSRADSGNMDFDPGTQPADFWKYGVLHYHMHNTNN